MDDGRRQSVVKATPVGEDQDAAPKRQESPVPCKVWEEPPGPHVVQLELPSPHGVQQESLGPHEA
jgi:hypothetical protein